MTGQWTIFSIRNIITRNLTRLNGPIVNRYCIMLNITQLNKQFKVFARYYTKSNITRMIQSFGRIIIRQDITRLTQQIIVVTRYMTITNFTSPIHPIVSNHQNHYTECHQIEPIDFNGFVIVRQILCRTIHHPIDPPDFH